MLAWRRTADGWALNLDGTDAAREFTLPRVELHAGPQGWTGVCHLENGTSRQLSVGRSASARAAMRAALREALLVLGPGYESAVRPLLA